MRRIAIASVVLVLAAAACSSGSARPDAGGRPTTPTTLATTLPPTAVALTTRPPHPHHRASATPTAARTTAQATRRPFRWGSSHVTAASLGKSWHAGCPVGPAGLRAISLTFWGFDGRAHQGTLIGSAGAVPAYVTAFRAMYAARFPIRQLRPVSAYGGSDNRSMAADNTSAFNCRYAVANGPKHWSMHAYGGAIDINPRENPYRLNGKVLPPAGKPYMDRSNVRSGMIVTGSAAVHAFSAIGWGWGGRWSSTPDYQHFSSNGQ
jgi:hypothetical protein